MTNEDPETSVASKLVSVPGMAALAVLGITLIALSRAFGAENILREVVTEVIAGFGNAIFILVIFGLFFRSSLYRVLRRAPGGDTFAESTERLREILQDLVYSRASPDSLTIRERQRYSSRLPAVFSMA